MPLNSHPRPEQTEIANRLAQLAEREASAQAAALGTDSPGNNQSGSVAEVLAEVKGHGPSASHG